MLLDIFYQWNQYFHPLTTQVLRRPLFLLVKNNFSFQKKIFSFFQSLILTSRNCYYVQGRESFKLKYHSYQQKAFSCLVEIIFFHSSDVPLSGTRFLVQWKQLFRKSSSLQVEINFLFKEKQFLLFSALFWQVEILYLLMETDFLSSKAFFFYVSLSFYIQWEPIF